MNSLEAKDWGALRGATVREDGKGGRLDSDSLEGQVRDHLGAIICE